MKLLYINSSINGQNSVSREVSAAVVSEIAHRNPQTEVIYRDLAADPPPYMTLETLPTSHPLSVKPDQLNEVQLQARHVIDRIQEEFLSSDLVVLGAPMYNFGIATQLKSWIDTIVVPGKTFKFGPNGPVGLMGSKRVILVVSRGARYGDGNNFFPLSFEHAETYLSAVFTYIGITNPIIIVTEGVAFDRAGAISATLDRVSTTEF